MPRGVPKVKSYPMQKGRYQVIEVSGWVINPASWGRHSAPSFTWAVLDSADCFKEVGIFTVGPSSSRKKKAEKLAEELNRLEYQYEVRRLREELEELRGGT